MKRLILLATTALVAWSCNNDFEENYIPSNDTTKEISVTVSTASNDASSRVAISENTSNDELEVTWADGDNLGAWSESLSSFSEFTMNSGSLSDDKESATFTGNIGIEDSYYRLIHPYVSDAVIANGIYNLDLSSQINDLGDDAFSGLNQSLYMISPIMDADEDANPSMSHVGAIAQLNLRFTNLPEVTDAFELMSVNLSGGSNMTFYQSASLDLSKDVNDDDFMTNFVKGAITSTSSSSAYITDFDDSGVTYELKFNLLPLTFAAGSEFNIYIVLKSGDTKYFKTFTLANTTEVDVELTRATHITLNKICDMSEAGSTTLQGSGTASDPWQLTSAEDMLLVGEGLGLDAHYLMMNDIDLKGDADNQWAPIGTFSGYGIDIPFTGVFDGGEHTLSGLYIVNSGYLYGGLFNSVQDAIIKNLTIEGEINISYSAAGFAAVAYNSSFINCINKVDITTTSAYAGGFVAIAQQAPSFENCHNYADIDASEGTGTGTSAGGLLGYCYWSTDSLTINNCSNSGDIKAAYRVGGLVGYTSHYSPARCVITDCSNSGNITATSSEYAGGIIGYGANVSSIYNCSNTGDITATTNYAGGICGYIYLSNSIDNCTSTTGTISGNDRIGGITGYNASTGTITNCSNSSTVNGVEYVGGIVADNGGVINYCNSIGDISSTSSGATYTGGIAGYSTGTINNSYTEGSVTTTSNASSSSYTLVGGIVGRAEGTVINCYSESSIKASSTTGALIRMGGITGYIDTAKTVKNCYAKCDITLDNSSTSYVGGIAGYQQGVIDNCYSASTISLGSNVSSGTQYGGVVAYASSSNITNCYYDNTIYTLGGITTGSTGMETEAMQETDFVNTLNTNAAEIEGAATWALSYSGYPEFETATEYN